MVFAAVQAMADPNPVGHPPDRRKAHLPAQAAAVGGIAPPVAQISSRGTMKSTASPVPPQITSDQSATGKSMMAVAPVG